jgi:predicted kinase
MTITLITGPCGSGKSTITEELAKKSKYGVVINVDKIRHLIKGGYEVPWAKTSKAKKQKNLAINNACSLARNFLKEGVNVFIDDVIYEKEAINLYRKILGNEIKFFLLLPNKEVLVARDSARTQDSIMGARVVELHELFNKNKNKIDWHIIDNSNLTIDETIEQIKNTF